MDRTKRNLVYCGISAVLLLIISNCSSRSVNLVDSGIVSLERIKSKEVKIIRAYVYQEEDQLVIRGRVRLHNPSGAASGHVDVAIIGPEGTLIEKGSVHFHPRILTGKRREGRFEAKFSLIPPEGSKVRLAYHELQTSIGATFDCKENLAIPE